MWNSFNCKNFNEIPRVNDDMIVIVANGHNPSIAIYNASGLDVAQREELAKLHGKYITAGCNYTYDVVRVIGNVYFLN